MAVVDDLNKTTEMALLISPTEGQALTADQHFEADFSQRGGRNTSFKAVNARGVSPRCTASEVGHSASRGIFFPIDFLGPSRCLK